MMAWMEFENDVEGEAANAIAEGVEYVFGNEIVAVVVAEDGVAAEDEVVAEGEMAAEGEAVAEGEMAAEDGVAAEDEVAAEDGIAADGAAVVVGFVVPIMQTAQILDAWVGSSCLEKRGAVLSLPQGGELLRIRHRSSIHVWRVGRRAFCIPGC
jgi:hypothetical protein